MEPKIIKVDNKWEHEDVPERTFGNFIRRILGLPLKTQRVYFMNMTPSGATLKPGETIVFEIPFPDMEEEENQP